MSEKNRTVKQLTDFQVRWRYERIVECWLDALGHFHALRENAPDPELRKGAGEAWDAISKIIVGLRDRFGLAWVDSKEHVEALEKELEEPFPRKPPRLGQITHLVCYTCYDCGFDTNSYDEAKAHHKETAHTSFRKQTVLDEHIQIF